MRVVFEVYDYTVMLIITVYFEYLIDRPNERMIRKINSIDFNVIYGT